MLINKILSSEEVLSRVPNSIKRAHSEGTLHQLLAEKTGSHGGFTVEAALRDLGQKLYFKNAQWNLVRRGLESLKEL